MGLGSGPAVILVHIDFFLDQLHRASAESFCRLIVTVLNPISFIILQDFCTKSNFFKQDRAGPISRFLHHFDYVTDCKNVENWKKNQVNSPFIRKNRENQFDVSVIV
jgi:hypothetical protein